MSSGKKIVIVVSPGDNVVRDLVEKLNALQDDHIVLLESKEAFAEVSPFGFPVILIQATAELGCVMANLVLVEETKPVWKKKTVQQMRRDSSFKKMTRPGTRPAFRRFGKRHV